MSGSTNNLSTVYHEEMASATNQNTTHQEKKIVKPKKKQMANEGQLFYSFEGMLPVMRNNSIGAHTQLGMASY